MKKSSKKKNIHSAEVCPRCYGDPYFDYENEDNFCKSCNGTGLKDKYSKTKTKFPTNDEIDYN